MKIEAKDRSWIWNSNDWFSFKDIDQKFLTRCFEIDKNEDDLLQLYSGLSNKEKTWILADEILSNWKIEGIYLSRESIRDSLAVIFNIDNIDQISEKIKEKNASEATYLALSDHKQLTIEHILLLHKKIKNDDKDDWGIFRNHSESVYGRDIDGKLFSVYDAPPANMVFELMKKYIEWWNISLKKLPRSAGSILAHLFFVTIHPFRDGNGRIARILADKYLSLRTNQILRTYSISYEIEKNKTQYYMALESITENDGMSAFLDFMLSVYANAIDEAKKRNKILLRIYSFLSKNKIYLDDNDKQLLKTLAFDSKNNWSFISATQFMDNGDIAQKSWNKLCKIGLITNGKLTLHKNR